MYLSPKTIIVEFLRKNVSDPRGRITNTTDTIVSILNQTEFQLTPTTGKKLSHINSVSIDSVDMVKWRDYYIDHKLQQVILFTAIAAGKTVLISYGETSSNWIFPDKPNEKLNALAFPRMNISIISNPGIRLGNYEAPIEAIPRMQIDIWCKEKQDNQIFEIDNHNYAGEDLAEYLSYQITNAFEDEESELFPALYGYEPVGMSPDLPFDEQMQCHHKIVEFVCRGISIGSIN